MVCYTLGIVALYLLPYADREVAVLRLKLRMGMENRDDKGFTLVEVLVVVLLVGVLASLVLPSANRVLSTTRRRVEAVEYDLCMKNCDSTKQLYEDFLAALGQDHSDELFREFLYRLERYGRCAQGGRYYYDQGSVLCDRHQPEETIGLQCLWAREETATAYGDYLASRPYLDPELHFGFYLLEHDFSISCPEGGMFQYTNGSILCSRHTTEQPGDPSPDPPSDVPFL